MTLPVSARARGIIVAFEVTSQAVYERDLIHPTWPEGGSGITIGIGYDVGYSTPDQVMQDWSAHLSPVAMRVLLTVVGLKGAEAQRQLWRVAGVTVPWDAALDVFDRTDLARYATLAAGTFQNCDALSPDSFGALVSLVMNRGAAMQDTAGYPGSRLEMRQIRDAMAARRFDAVPDFLLAMRRLWPTMAGLRDRRAVEAGLFRDGLASPAPIPAPAPAAPPVADPDDTADALNAAWLADHPQGA